MSKLIPSGILLLLLGGQAVCLTLASDKESQQTSSPERRRDRFGDPLPPGAIARLGSLRLGHRARNWTVTSSRDGRTFLVGGSAEIPPEGGGLSGLGAIGLGGFGGIGGIGGLGGLGGLLGGGGAMPPPVASSVTPWVKIGNDAPVLLIDSATGRLLRSIHVHPAGVDGLALSPDRKLLAVRLTTGPLQLRDATTGKLVRRLGEQVQGNSTLAFSPDGKALALLGWESRGCLFKVRTGRILHRFGPATGGRSLAFSPDGKTIACSGGEAVTLCDARTGKQLWRLPMQFSVWLPLCFSPDGKTLAVGAADGTIRLIASASGKLIRQWEAEPGLVFAVAFAPSGHLLASAGKSSVHLWDAGTGKAVRRLHGCGGSISSLAFSRDGKALATSTAEGVRLWDIASGKEIVADTGHRAPIRELLFSPEGQALLSRDSHGNALCWEVHSGKPLPVLPKFRDPGTILAFSPDGKLFVAMSKDGTLRLCERATGKELRRGKAKLAPEGSFAFLPDGKILVAREKEDGIHVCDVFTGRSLPWPEKQRAAAYMAAITLDGRTLLTGGPGPITLWDVRTSKEIRQFEEAVGQLTALAVAPDGRTVASGTDDGTVRLWEAASGRQVLSVQGHCAGVCGIAFSPNGRTLATGSNDFTVLLWDVTGLHGANRSKTPLSPDSLARLWDTLGGRDAAAAHRAAWRLTDSAREAVPFLARQLKPVPTLTAEQVRQLVADLAHRRFRVRQAAFNELERIGSVALPALCKALEGRPTLEVRRRVEELQRNIQASVPPAGRLREIRAVAVLERSGGTGAGKVLRALAGGLPEARLTDEAKAALKRLANKTPTPD